jgi:hypothetical protein
MKESIKDLKETQAETSLQIKESERMLTEQHAETERMFRESRADFDRQIKELTEKQAETDRLLKESRDGFEMEMKGLIESHVEGHEMLKDLIRQHAETEWTLRVSSAKLDKKIDRIAEMTGGVSESHGAFAEEYFFNAFYRGNREFFGEKFDNIEKNHKGNDPGEYDILLINGKVIAIIEVKFKAKVKYINEIFKKIKVFRINFPEYESHKIYFGMAAMVFDKTVEQKCLDESIAVIKQVGDTVVISDQNLKTF